MKIKIIYAKHILLAAFLLICSQLDIYSQGRVFKKVNKPGLFFGFSGGLAQTQIKNEGTLSVADLQSKEMNSYVGSFELGYFFSRHVGLSTGCDYISYKTELTLSTYQNKFDAIDSENEPYERRVTGSDIKEAQDIAFIIVPLYLNLRLPYSKSFGFFLQSGANVSVPISKSYSSSGTFTYKGYYSAYNVLLENLPDYGFPGNHNTFATGELKLQPYNFNFVSTAGIDIFVQKKLKLIFAFTYSKSLSDISAYDSTDKFQLSSDVDQINSLMGGSSKASVQSLGLKISLRYFLR